MPIMQPRVARSARCRALLYRGSLAGGKRPSGSGHEACSSLRRHHSVRRKLTTGSSCLRELGCTCRLLRSHQGSERKSHSGSAWHMATLLKHGLKRPYVFHYTERHAGLTSPAEPGTSTHLGELPGRRISIMEALQLHFRSRFCSGASLTSTVVPHPTQVCKIILMPLANEYPRIADH